MGGRKNLFDGYIFNRHIHTPEKNVCVHMTVIRTVFTNKRGETVTQG